MLLNVLCHLVLVIFVIGHLIWEVSTMNFDVVKSIGYGEKLMNWFYRKQANLELIIGQYIVLGADNLI